METVTQPEAQLARPSGNGKAVVPRVQPVLMPWLRAQAINLSRHAKALRPFRRDEFGAGPEAPTEGHIQAVNQAMSGLQRGLARRARELARHVGGVMREPATDQLQRLVTHKHSAHAWVTEVEKIWDFYFELFGQRQSKPYGEWLLGCDRIALDCYQAAYLGLGKEKSIPAPPPFSYMRTGFGPATFRRGVPLSRLGKRLNPFPLIQLPYHRLINPWTLGAILHEVSHNLQADLGLNLAVPRRIARRCLAEGLGASVARVWTQWNREMFADLSGLLLGGPAVVASLMDVVGRSPGMVLTFSSRGVHPTPYLRTLLSVELLRRMGFKDEAETYSRSWRRIYPDPSAGFPAVFLNTAPRAMASVIEGVCYQPFHELGGKSLAQVLRFEQKEQRMIEEAARRFAAGTDPGIIPARFLVGAARFALDARLASSEVIKDNFYKELARR